MLSCHHQCLNVIHVLSLWLVCVTRDLKAILNFNLKLVFPHDLHYNRDICRLLTLWGYVFENQERETLMFIFKAQKSGNLFGVCGSRWNTIGLNRCHLYIQPREKVQCFFFCAAAQNASSWNFLNFHKATGDIDVFLFQAQALKFTTIFSPMDHVIDLHPPRSDVPKSTKKQTDSKPQRGHVNRISSGC